jgi:hypothetical protein
MDANDSLPDKVFEAEGQVVVLHGHHGIIQVALLITV